MDIKNIEIDCMKDVVIDSPERTLWLSVIQQAFLDAYYGYRPSASNPTYEDLSRHYARVWLSEASKDFYVVCDLAGISPKYVKKAALKLFEKEESRKLGEDAALSEKELIF